VGPICGEKGIQSEGVSGSEWMPSSSLKKYVGHITCCDMKCHGSICLHCPGFSARLICPDKSGCWVLDPACIQAIVHRIEVLKCVLNMCVASLNSIFTSSCAAAVAAYVVLGTRGRLTLTALQASKTVQSLLCSTEGSLFFSEDAIFGKCLCWSFLHRV
jgi:hypothetical protein